MGFSMCMCMKLLPGMQHVDLQDADSLGFDVGELEKATPAAPPPPAPTTAADFSWGGARTSQSGPALTSLRDIQSQEAAVTLRPGMLAADQHMLELLYSFRLWKMPGLTYKMLRLRHFPVQV